MRVTALIMAGGRGERFWPRSRKDLPKQFLSLTNDGKTLIQLTVERILPIVDAGDIFISTNKNYLPLVKQQLPQIDPANIICEPVGRNTAPGIGLGAAYISKKYDEDTIMLVLPSDHLIKYNQMYISTLKDAIEVAGDGNNLVTMGIAPDFPETGYGYIKFIPNVMYKRSYRVEHFAEKPNLEKAKEYLSTDEYLWNSGMFVWKVSSIMNCFERFMPDVFEGLNIIKDAISTSQEEEILDKIYPGFPSISIDYGIMEKSEDIYTIPGNFGWDDVGSWLALERIQTSNEFGNIAAGNVITVSTSNCIIQGRDKLIATVGLEDTVIVDTEDATLICAKDSTADIKKVLENLKICNRNEYL